MSIPLHTMFWTWLLGIIQIYVFLNSHWSPYGLLIAIEENSCSFTKKSSFYWVLYLQWEHRIRKTLILLFSICDSLLMVKDLISMFLWPHNLILQLWICIPFKHANIISAYRNIISVWKLHKKKTKRTE